MTNINSHDRVNAVDSAKEAKTRQSGERTDAYLYKKHSSEGALIQTVKADRSEVLIELLLSSKANTRDRLLQEIFKLEQIAQVKDTIFSRHNVESKLSTFNVKEGMRQNSELQVKIFFDSLPEHIKDIIKAAGENTDRNAKAFLGTDSDEKGSGNANMSKHYVYMSESLRKEKAYGSIVRPKENILLIFVIFLALGLLILWLIR